MIFVADDIEKPPEKGLHRLVTQVPCHFVFPPVRQLCLGQFPFLLASLASKLAKELSCFKSSGEENVGRYLPPLPSGFCAVSLHKFPTVPSPPDGPPSPDVHLGVGMVSAHAGCVQILACCALLPTQLFLSHWDVPF